MAEKIGELIEDSNPNLHFCDISLHSENLGSSCSLSLPSEPPDIRNWFSSYIYESPELDTQDDFKCFVSGEIDRDKQGINYKEIGREKEKNLGEIGNLGGGDASDFDEKISFSPVNKGNKRVESNLSITKIDDDDSLEAKSAKDYDLDLLKDDLNSWLNKGDSLQKSERNFFSDVDLLKKQAFVKDNSKEVDYISLKSNVDSRRINFTSPEKSSLQNNGEEEEGKSFVTNGFISTKKIKDTSDQSRRSLKRSQENQVEHVRNIEMVSRGERMPLSDRSNVEYKVDDKEMTGKWRCPQKSKPELGPPLKQLRLQHWVRRI